MASPFMVTLLVGFGGFAGSLARYGLSVAAQRHALVWPLGTLAANVLGCLTIGLIMGIAARGDAVPPAVRLALATGFCGGFTTLSSLVYETAEMVRAREYLHAAGYVGASFLLSFAAFAAGMLAVRLAAKAGGLIWN